MGGITIRPIIVTGAAGFIGSTLVETILNKYDIPVIGIDDLSAGKQKNIDRLKRCFGSECFTFRQIDITDRESLEKLFWESKPAVVFHQAASKKNICLKDPHRDLEVNGGGTLNLLELSRQYQVEKFIHASTGSVYGENSGTITEESPLAPVSFYGVSKLAGGRYVAMFHNQYGLNTTILRYFHVYGKHQDNTQDMGGVIAIWIRLLKEGKPIIIHGSGNQIRSFTHVSDIVKTNLMAYERQNDTAGKVYNVASGIKINLHEALHTIAQEMDIKKITIEYEPELPGDIRKFDVNNRNTLHLIGGFKTFKEGISCTASGV